MLLAAAGLCGRVLIWMQHFETGRRHGRAHVDNQRALFNARHAKMRMQVGGQQAFGGGVQLLPVARAVQEVGKGGVGGDKGGKLHVVWVGIAPNGFSGCLVA